MGKLTATQWCALGTFALLAGSVVAVVVSAVVSR